MPKEITLEVRQKIFALYYNQIVANNKENHHAAFSVSNIFQLRCKKYIQYKYELLLKPLSSITNEDATLLVDFFHEKGERNYEGNTKQKIAYGKLFAECLLYSNGSFILSPGLVLFCIDYLRSKGYALPAYGFTVEELVEAGVFKLKEG